jgi:choline dehydrogenase-like flavoprotein
MSILDARRARTLAAVCDTFVPPGSADDPGGTPWEGCGPPLAERVERLIGMIPDPEARGQLLMLLDILGSRIANLLLRGSPRGFADLNAAAREAAMRSWAESSIQLRRAGFQALKRLCLVAYYAWPTGSGGHPAWRINGYPGPLPPPPGPGPRLRTTAVEVETTLGCDAVVVGSGAGGGVAAGVLAAAGLDVVVLEKGENLGPEDFTQVEGDMLSRGYLDHGLLLTRSGSLPILSGSCVGGGTVINYTTSFPLPDRQREEWDRLAGFSLFRSHRFEESVERVSRRLGVGTEWTTPGGRDELLERGLTALGWHVGAMPRNVTGCLQGLECGYCGYGCRHGAKNTTADTYLRDAAGAGARVVARCDVRRVLKQNGRAAGVEAVVTGPNGRRLKLVVRAPIVVAACGALNTPALLVRSGLDGPLVGRGLRLHPGTAIAGVFRERVEPWSGSLQTRYSDQMADLHNGYGAKFETVPIHFAMPASAFGWEGAAAHRNLIARLAHISIAGVLLRDRDGGRVATGRDGRARAHYEISGYDAWHLRRALVAAAEVMAAAGATEVFSLQQPPAQARVGGSGWLEDFVSSMDARGYTHCRMACISFHQMASCAMGADPRRGVLSEAGESFALPGLFVADAGAFPTSSGVNPMITIMAIADHVARGIAERR